MPEDSELIMDLLCEARWDSERLLDAIEPAEARGHWNASLDDGAVMVSRAPELRVGLARENAEIARRINPFDYRDLLKRYIAFVYHEESVFYVPYPSYSETRFSKEEVAEIERIVAELGGE